MAKDKSSGVYDEWLTQGYESLYSQDAPRFPGYLEEELPAAPPEKDTSWRGRARRFYDFIAHPVPVGELWDEDIPWTKSFLKSFAGISLNPIGFFWKLISLTVFPAFYSVLSFFVSLQVIGLSKEVSFGISIAAFFWYLFHSIVCLRARPLAVEVTRLFMHENALIWLKWIVGSAVYVLALNWKHYDVEQSKWSGLVAAGIAYFVGLLYISDKTGSLWWLPYLAQVTMITVLFGITAIFGYVASPAIWGIVFSSWLQPWGQYVGAMLFSLAGFFIWIELLYVQSETNSLLGFMQKRERGPDLS